MKKTLKTLLVAGFTTTITAMTAFSQPVITVDEFGNGLIGTNALAGGLGTDPFSGITTQVYFLPFLGVRGDILLGNSDGSLSDLFRFDGNSNLFVFSDKDLTEPNPSPADVGFPASFLANALFFPETGPVIGLNGLFGYNPGVNDPGYVTTGVTYNFISDPTPAPEPSSLALLAIGLGICSFGIRRCQAARA